MADNARGGKILSARVGGVEKLSVSGNGNVVASGNVTAASFSGSGAGLTGVAALTAASAANATNAATANNANNLGGVPAASYARRDTTNTFSGDQTVNGNLTVNGTVTGTQFYGDGSGLTVSATALAAVLARLETLENIVLPSRPNGVHLFSKAFPTVYVAGFGSQDDDRGAAVAADPSGNIFITGWTMGPVDFGGGPHTVPSRTGGGLFLAKFSGVDGSHLWSKVLGSADSGGTGRAVAVDASGNVILGGTFNGTMDFGGGPPLPAPGPYNQGAFVAKFSGVNGSNIWSRAFPYSQFDLGATVAVDATGRVLVTGSFIGTGDFGAGPVTSAGAGDVFVAEYSGVDGSHLWSRHFASSVGGYGLGRGVAADASGNVVVTGALAGTMDFGGGPLTSYQSEEIFLLKLSGVNGSHLWSKHFAHAYGRFWYNPKVAVDTNGNVYLTGGFFDGADFGGGPLPGISNVASIFVAKLSGADGTHLWSKGFGRVPGCSGTTCGGEKWGHGIAVDTSGNVVVTAESSGTVDFGAGPLTGLGPYGGCMLVAKFTGADGSHLWSKCFSSSDGGATAAGTAVDASGNVLVTGEFGRTMDFGGGPLTSTPSQEEPGYYPPDIYLLKLHF